MAKFSIAVVLIAVICQGSALPLVEEDGDIARAAAAGDWDRVHDIIAAYISGRMSSLQSQSQSIPTSGSIYRSPPSTIGSLKAPDNASPGGRYFSQSEYTYSRQSNNNGVVKKDEGGLGKIDDNGRVTYYKPKTVPIDPVPYTAPLDWNNGLNKQYGISPYGG